MNALAERPLTRSGSEDIATDDHGFVKALTRRKDRLFPLIWQFNHQPARYIDPSHMPEMMDSPVWDRVKTNRRALDLLSHAILRKFRLNEEYCFTFEDPRARLTLVDPATLSRLLTYAGAGLCSPRIARELGRDRLAALKKSLGESVYSFAVRRAPLLISNGVRTQLAEVEVNTGNLEADIKATGQRLLEICLTGQPRGATERWRLKFPRTIRWNFSGQTAPSSALASLRTGDWQNVVASSRPRLGGSLAGGANPAGTISQRSTLEYEAAAALTGVGVTNPAEAESIPETRPLSLAEPPRSSPAPVADEKTVAAAWNLVHRLLTREVAPAWSSCFT